ncbi:MAG TPA: pyrophosphate--fructose-6-phosphate 1-phosphotransferase [Candidatus Cloacimonas sp.]|jgi:pyrophosphate--fructose-6-phosphate 1-phosphotransferase|nr:diphosphate-dependent phosphofructokinase [Candidatus Cloacimonadota bacterium]HCX73103.1 pyrophosphate--fructose-6-phosphate 1-phosphotransferase [Candidatus Cloacimonas sp.]
MKHRIGILTAGGLAPCLSACVGRLIKKYSEHVPEAEIVGYLNGYQGLLVGKSIEISNLIREKIEILYEYGGSVLGNSRVKLSNVKDCVKKGLVKPGQNPLHVAAERLRKDGITILHTIGGDDTNTTAANLSAYLEENGYELTVIGLPKTIDNDIIPIKQTLGAWTAAEQTAIFFENMVNENTTSPRQLLIHEVMGRNCGWLTATSAYEYRKRLAKRKFLPEFLLTREKWDVDAVYLPELHYDFDEEVARLLKLMDKNDCVNIFISEGAGVERIVAQMEADGEEVKRDAFGHVRLDDINVGEWYGKRFAKVLDAKKTLVLKSGYFARSAAPNKKDLELIFKTCDQAVQFGLNGESGVVGQDEDYDGEMRCIEFERIKGGRPFDTTQEWFRQMLKEIGQGEVEMYPYGK